MAKMRYGFHEGPTGPRVPDEFFTTLNSSGIPFVLKITDSAPNIKALQLARANPQIPHTIIFRRSTGPLGSGYDVPDYSLAPLLAAAKHWQRHLAEFPQEVKDNKDVCWVETINEVDKNRAEWLAEFAIHTANLAWNDGYKWLAFGWSSGEPEPEHWQGLKMLEFLSLCAANRHRLGIALHEYSYNDDIWNGTSADGTHWLVGRFEHLLAVCDANGIPYPRIDVTEWGYGRDKNTLPNQPQRLSDYVGVWNLYNAHIASAAVWCLNSGEWGGLENEIVQDIEPIKNMTLDLEFEDIEPPPPPTNKPKIVIVKKPQKADMTEAENHEVSLWAWLNYGRTTTHSTDDMMQMLRGGNDESYAVVWWADRQPDVIASLNAAGFPYITMPEAPAPSFSFTHWPTPHRVVTQEFLANPQNYEQFGLPGHEGVDIRAYHGDPVYTVADGTVSQVNTNPTVSNYGIFVRVAHADGYETTYAHLREAVRSVGEKVYGGDVIGLADNTGNSFGDHLHLTLKKQVPTFTDRCGNIWVWNTAGYCIIDPTPYLVAFGDSVEWPGGSPGFPCPGEPPEPPPINTIDVLSYMQAHPKAWRVVYNQNRQGQDVQDMDLGGGMWVRRKGTTAEWWKQDGKFAYLIHDTSPSAINGREVCYTIIKNGIPGMSPKNPAKMAVGDTWQESGSHLVQFKYKSGCGHITTPPTGNNTNWAKLLWHNPFYKFPALNTTFDCIGVLTTNNELQIYGKINAESSTLYSVPVGLVIGWCGWESEWGQSYLEELYFGRGEMIAEPNRFCNWE